METVIPRREAPLPGSAYSTKNTNHSMSTPKINISTELMKNYKQTELMSPEKKFEALQTPDGHSLLFSIGTDDAFYVTQETIGHGTGWEKTDLSKDLIGKSFSGMSGITVKTFDAGQSAEGTIGLAMVVSDGTNDHLFLCLGNSASDTSWTKAPPWTRYPFDAGSPGAVSIVDVFVSETGGGKQYIVVDILRDPTKVEKLVSRFYIDTIGASPAWQSRDLPVDVEAEHYSTCLGRRLHHRPQIDGFYTYGLVNGSVQFTFQPVYDEFDTNNKPPGPARPVELQAPPGASDGCIAACRKSDLSTDLYLCTGGSLYYYESDKQTASDTPLQLFPPNAAEGIFNGVKKMYAAQSDQTSVVWGLNGNDQIFYTSCNAGQETSPSAWSTPLPIVTGVDMFSPYLNRVDDGNTFFAVAGNALQKLTKSTDHSIWRSQNITLPSPNTSDTQKYSSYTTRILVTGDNNKPLPNEQVTISSKTRTPVYINYLYYVVDSTGIKAETDQMGTITVVEWITGLTGAQLDVTDSGGNRTSVNPMDKPFGKIAQLNTKDSLKSAVVRDGKTGEPTPLIDRSVSDGDLDAVAAANKNLGTVYNTIKPSGASRPAFLMGVTGSAGDAFVSAISLDSILVDAGDLFRWMESGVEALVQVVADAAEGVWHFVATIAGKAYSCVLDAVEHVVAAAVWVFNQIKTGIEKLIQFLEFLFEWNDILVTHRVMKNVFTHWAQDSLDRLANSKQDITSAFGSIRTDLDKWAGITTTFTQTPDSASATGFPHQDTFHSAPANLGAHHFQGNAASATSAFSPGMVGEDIFKEFLDLLEKQGDAFSATCGEIKTDIIDNIGGLSITQIITKFAAILTNTLLDSLEDVLLAAIDVFITLASGLMDALTATIDIPVLSWLYKEITHGDDLSILDVVCLIAAIPATIVYKVSANKAPFPDGDEFTKGLLNAQKFDDVRGVFMNAPPRLQQARMGAAPAMALDTEPVLDEDRLKTLAYVTGLFAAVGSFVLIFVTLEQRTAGEAGSPKIISLLAAVGNMAYVSPNLAGLINIESDDPVGHLNNILTGISVVKGFVNIQLATAPAESVGPRFSAYAESVINILWNVPVIWNIANNSDRVVTKYKSLIPESAGNFLFNFGGTLEYPICVTEDVKVKAAECAAQYLLMGGYGLLIAAAGWMYALLPDQSHA